MSYNIKLEIFEGPMDLLLHLVQKEEIDIYKVPVAKIIDEYLNYISIMKELDINIASEFLIMASTLLELKSKMILPPKPELLKTNEITDEEDNIITPEQLLNKIAEYEKYKKIGELLSELEKTEKKYFTRPDIKNLDDLSLDDLVFSLQNILKKKEPKIRILPRENITVEEMRSFIINKVKIKKVLNFSDLFLSETNRLKIITAFLAMLELILEKKIRVKQEKKFDNIILYRK